MELNLNKTTLLFFLIIILLFSILPTGVANITLFVEVIIFGIYTLRRMGRKYWNNAAITKQERGRAIYIITLYAAICCCITLYWMGVNIELLDKINNLLLVILLCLQGIIMNYIIFQINIELNYYGNADHKEGLLTRIIKGRTYHQSNS